MVDERRQQQRWIAAAAGDDDLGAVAQRGDHGLRIHVDVRGDELPALLERHVGLVDLEPGEIDAIAHIVSSDDADPDRPEPEALREPRHDASGAFRIRGAKVP
jgi:hypothetical protein